jgi:hypothetical protein
LENNDKEVKEGENHRIRKLKRKRLLQLAVMRGAGRLGTGSLKVPALG